jgi:hypothetical protein
VYLNSLCGLLFLGVPIPNLHEREIVVAYGGVVWPYELDPQQMTTPDVWMPQVLELLDWISEKVPVFG